MTTSTPNPPQKRPTRLLILAVLGVGALAAGIFGYRTTKNLQVVLSELSQEDLAAVVNPGIAPRRHLNPV